MYLHIDIGHTMHAKLQIKKNLIINRQTNKTKTIILIFVQVD